jgi:DNA-directed RNA polymerase subunit RPC12/RpoP
MSDLFSAGRPSAVPHTRDKLKSALKFGEVASDLGLAGSSRRGWDCPSCGAEFAVRETENHRGGRCKSCGEGFDIINLVRETEDLGFEAALKRLSSILDEKSKPKKGMRRLF